MSHKRLAIREKIIGRLLNKTGALDRVFESRVRAVWKESLPCIGVFTEREDVAIYAVAPREYKRTLTVVLELYCEATDNADDALDVLALEVEAVMDEADDLDGTVSDTEYRGVEIALQGEARAITGVARMTYEITYYTTAGVKVADGDAWETGSVTWTNTPDNVTDTVELPQ